MNIIIETVVVLLLCWWAYSLGVLEGRDSIVWLEDVDATVVYPDKYCYIVNKTIHDLPVRVRMCRERFNE